MTTAAAYVAEPAHIKRLARDKHDRPVPWFVAWIGGVPDFRIVKAGAVGSAVVGGWCWICGQLFEDIEVRAFVVGPMCGVNLVSSEPPSHYECAIYAATHCPFLTQPTMVRRDKHLPEGVKDPAGVFLKRNPGVTLVWIVAHDSWRAVRVGGALGTEGAGVLFHIGSAPYAAEWYAHGRPATRAEVETSIATGMPELRKLAKRDGPKAYAALNRNRAALAAHLPDR